MMNTPGSPSPIDTTNLSVEVSGTSMIAINKGGLGPALRFMRIWNISASDTIWASRAGVAEIGGAGSFPIGPGLYELWAAPGPVPNNQLQLISTGSATPVTIEVG